MAPAQPNGWEQHKRLVLYRLDDIDRTLVRLEDHLADTERRQIMQATTLRITAAAIGALAGLVPTVVALLISSRM